MNAVGSQPPAGPLKIRAPSPGRGLVSALHQAWPSSLATQQCWDRKLGFCSESSVFAGPRLPSLSPTPLNAGDLEALNVSRRVTFECVTSRMACSRLSYSTENPSPREQSVKMPRS